MAGVGAGLQRRDERVCPAVCVLGLAALRGGTGRDRRLLVGPGRISSMSCVEMIVAILNRKEL